MKVSPYIRIQWFHDELTRKTYPNAARLSERFDISVRQAQRDITYMRTDMTPVGRGMHTRLRSPCR